MQLQRQAVLATYLDRFFFEYDPRGYLDNEGGKGGGGGLAHELHAASGLMSGLSTESLV
jgi:hypothetical protein